MRTSQELDQLREQAAMLRRQGKSRRQIKEALGFISNSTLNQILRGEPLPPERAGPGYAESRRRAAEGVQRYWAAERPAREAARAAISAAAAAQVGDLTDREILIAGAVAYWCEGSKTKPYRLDEQVRFINSDPALIRFFLTFLDRAGVSRQRLRYCVHIHESADVEAATSYWAMVTGAAADQFVRPVIKAAHNPATTRKNISDAYHGCLRVDVRRSCELYRKLDGWASAVTRLAEAPSQPAAGDRTAPGGGFEPPSHGTKTRCLAWLDHPG
jgi:hypothetical protein